jgi:carbonyl reductase 1
LQQDSALLAARALRAEGGLSEIVFAPLDISDATSVAEFADFLKAEHPAGIDIGPALRSKTNETC